MKLSHKRLAAAALECVGIVVTSIGIGLELSVGGNVHLVTITAGSCLVAVGGMLWAKVRL